MENAFACCYDDCHRLTMSTSHRGTGHRGHGIMNANRIKGLTLIAIGRLQERAGWMCGSPTQQIRGFQKQFLGRSRIAMGDVQDIVKLCVKSRSESERVPVTPQH